MVGSEVDVTGQVSNIPPEFAEKMRQRRPGYDRILKLVLQYDEIPPDKRAQMNEIEVADQFVWSMFKALGWSGMGDESALQKGERTFEPVHLFLEYKGFRVPIEVRKFDDPLSSYTDKRIGPYEILTNFETILIWDVREFDRPQLVLKTSPWSYIADSSEEADMLAARVFYERLVQPGSTAPPPPAIEIEGTSTSQATHPVSAKISAQPVPHIEAEGQPSSKVELPPVRYLVEKYGEPEGPRQRYDEVIAGISFGGGSAPARTITALVTGKDGKPRLLLAGGTFPQETEVIQPAPMHGGQHRDKIGVVEHEVFSDLCLAAVARLVGHRPYLSALPDGQPITDMVIPSLGLPVCKFGGGSAYTQSTISGVSEPIDLTDDYQRQIRLREAFYVQGPGFSQPGDVGALVVTANIPHQAVGVIVGYRGDDTICLPIGPILEQLNVNLIPTGISYTLQSQVTDQIKAITDRPEGQDRLGFNHYVNAFVHLIQDTDPPLTVGIYGAWGSGKSFLLNLLRQEIRRKGLKAVIVDFEAWDYNATEKLWAGLVERIFRSIEDAGLDWRGQIHLTLEPTLKRYWRSLRPRLLPYTLIAIAVGLLTIGFILANWDALAASLTGLSAIVLIVELVRQLRGVFTTPASQRIVDLFATPDYKDDIGFMGRIRKDLKNIDQALKRESRKAIVFIDDLDRCEPQKAVEVLEAIKLLLDLDRFIVFLALDARIITQAIEEHYGKILVEAEITGYEYLDKIVQIPFSIPEPPTNELRKYVGYLMGMSEADIPPLAPMVIPTAVTQLPLTSEPGVSPLPPPPSGGTRTPEPVKLPELQPPPPPVIPDKIEQRSDTILVDFTSQEQETLLSFYEYLDPNPRRLKRLVNIYRLVRVLINSQPPLKPLDNRRHILGWLILCEQWPYAAHTILEILDQSLKQTKLKPETERLLREASILELHQAAQMRIAQEQNEILKKLDLKYERLQGFIETYLNDFTLDDLHNLRPFTVNFNPALSAEVRLTLSKGGGL